jgi:hypothetical protein
MPDFESGAFNRALPPLRFVFNYLPNTLIVPIPDYDVNYGVTDSVHPSWRQSLPNPGVDNVL